MPITVLTRTDWFFFLKLSVSKELGDKKTGVGRDLM